MSLSLSPTVFGDWWFPHAAFLPTVPEDFCFFVCFGAMPAVLRGYCTQNSFSTACKANVLPRCYTLAPQRTFLKALTRASSLAVSWTPSRAVLFCQFPTRCIPPPSFMQVCVCARGTSDSMWSPWVVVRGM